MSQTDVLDPTPHGGTRYHRVLLKLSGESFGGGSVGVDPDVVARIAREIAAVVTEGVEVAVVTGGGNFFRGAELSQRGMDRARADYMGMLGTCLLYTSPSPRDKRQSRMPSSA